MFTIASGYFKYRYNEKDRYSLALKSIDFSKKIEVFRIGNAVGIDYPGIDIFCVLMEGKIIPFCAYKSKSVKAIPIASFNLKNSLDAKSYAHMSVRDVTITRLGSDLSSFKIIRGQVSYHDLWLEDQIHGYEFKSEREKSKVFEIIQTAIPQIYFENYSNTYSPSPFVVRYVRPESGMLLKYNESGKIEENALSLLEPKNPDPESPGTIIETLKILSDEEPIRLEYIMSELHSVERMKLYYGNRFLTSCIYDVGLYDILRKSYDSYYMDVFPEFERFLVEIILNLNNRFVARSIFETGK